MQVTQGVRVSYYSARKYDTENTTNFVSYQQV